MYVVCIALVTNDQSYHTCYASIGQFSKDFTVQFGGLSYSYCGMMRIKVTFSQTIYGLEENYLSETYTQFYIPTEVSDQFSYTQTADGKPDVVQSLFTDAGKGALLFLINVTTSAQLPQEKDGITVPPEITSAPVCLIALLKF